MSTIARHCAACALPIDGPITICRGTAHYHPRCVPDMEPDTEIEVAVEPQDDGVAMVGHFDQNEVSA